MIGNGTLTAATLALGLLGLAGCRIHTEKYANGQDKNVQVDTPFGGIHVNTDQTTASDLGLPVYPGAEPVKDHDNHQSADVRLGFGEWQKFLKNEQLAVALADRLTENSHVINMKGCVSLRAKLAAEP